MRKNFRHFFGLAAIIALAGLVPFAVDVPRARANITRAQTNASFISNAKTDHSLGLTNPVLSGNTIIVAVSYEADDIINPINPVSDSLGNTYTLAKHQSGALETDIYYAINGFVTAPLTVTIDYQVASGINSHLVVAEYTGALELDQVSGFNVASGFSHPSAPSPGITIIGPALAITASRLTTGFDLQLDSTGFYTFCNGTPPGTAFCSPGSAGSAGTARFLVREATPLLEAAGTFPGVTGAWGSVALENSTNALAVFKEPDLTPPTVSLTAPIDGATVSGTVTVSADASDPTVAGQSSSGVAGVQFKLDGADLDLEDTTAPYSINWDTTGASAGSHTLTAVARDVAGNITTSLPVTIIVDNTSPVISGVSVEGITDTGATVSWTTDEEASDSQVEYGLDVSYGDSTVLDVSLVTSHTQDLSGLTPGTPYHYRVKSRDAAGNLATSADFTFTTAAFVDTIPPTVSLLSPAWGGVRGITLVSADASDNVGVAGVQFKASGANLGTEVTSFPYFFNWDTTTFPNGSYLLIEAVARDAAGNLTTSSPGAFVTVDNMPPAISLAEPADGATVSGVAVLISANASDVHTGVAGVQFKLDGNNLKAEDTAAPFSITWDTMTVANGSYPLTAVARDAAGNTTTASPISVTVNNPLPGGPSLTGVWQEPKYGPPFCGNAGCALPLTTLDVNQIIRSIGGNYATLGLNGVLRGGQRIFANDKIGVGPVPNGNPNGWNYEIDSIAALDVNGQIKIRGGDPQGIGGFYKTLIAVSADGLANWGEYWPLENTTIDCPYPKAMTEIESNVAICRPLVVTLQASNASGLILSDSLGETTSAASGTIALRINPGPELQIDASNQLRFATNCANGQIWQWNGSSWICADPPSFPAAPGNNIIYLKALGVGNEPPDCPAAGGFNTMDNTARESVGYLPGGANSVHRVRTCRQSNSNKRCQVLYLKSKINLPSCPGGFTPANSYSEYVPSDGVVNNSNNVQPCYRCVPS